MRVRDVIASEKTDIVLSKWKSGKVSRADFPLSKAKGRAYRLGASFRWRVISFSALGEAFKVLVLLDEGRHFYRAVLAQVVGSDLRILCQHEYHATDPGWHCHISSGPVSIIPTGIMRGPWVRRWPKRGGSHREFNIDESSAVAKAQSVYRIHERGLLL